MANHLDLEEQEQIDQLKHFWKQYGNGISSALILVAAAFAGWSGYQYWERGQASQAAGMFDELERVVATGDVAMSERAFSDIKVRFSGTVYSQNAGLIVAKLAVDKSKLDVAKSALEWVAASETDEGLSAVAKLRLAGVLADEKSFDKALDVLSGKVPAEFAALFSDRKGDILLALAKTADAKVAYQSAFAGFDDQSEYRRLVEIKLNALGGQAPKVEGPKS